MTTWIALAVILAAVNLTRMVGRGLLVALGAMASLVALALLLPASTPDWLLLTAAVASVGAVVITWHRLVLRAERRRMALGLAVFVAGCAVQVVLLDRPAAALATPWLWIAALLALADPSTRILRWGMGLVGKPQPDAVETYGRGEAIGVLERWIVLIVLARGQYAAMAFILAAKTLARHTRFEDDPEFAEYFLVGTLASVLLAIAAVEALRALGVIPAGSTS